MGDEETVIHMDGPKPAHTMRVSGQRVWVTKIEKDEYGEFAIHFEDHLGRMAHIHQRDMIRVSTPMAVRFSPAGIVSVEECADE